MVREVVEPIKVPVDSAPTKRDDNPEETLDLTARFGDASVAKMAKDYSAEVNVAIEKAESISKVFWWLLLPPEFIALIFFKI